MFWEENDCVEDSQLYKKLESENIDLQLILDDIHCFQEIRNNNEKLLAYLTQELVIKELVEAALLPKIDETMYEKEQYRFSHQCCEAICLSNKEIVKAIVENPDIMKMIVNFLKFHPNEINHLVVSFYAKIIVHLLGADTEKVLNMLEDSEFLENCMENICYGAIFEVLCGIINCAHDNDLRDRVKMVILGFVNRLISSISVEKLSEIHENASAVWAEFVKSLRDLQYTLELPTDPLLNTLQSRESVQKLLDQMFPVDISQRSYSVISNGVTILNAMLETNYVANSPSSIIAQEAQGNSVQMGQENPLFVPDPERIVELLCADKAVYCLQSIFNAFQKSNDYSGDVLLNCSQLLVNLVNTNYLPTHNKLIIAFKEFRLEKLFYAVLQNPTCTVFNSALSNFVFYILYSHTGEDNSLLHYLFKELNILQYILTGLKMLNDSVTELNLIKELSLRSFLMNLAERIQHCRRNGHQKDSIDQLINENPESKEWNEFCQITLIDYLSSNCTETIDPERRSTSDRISKVLEIDEVQDMDMSFMSPIKSPNFGEDIVIRRSTSPTGGLFDHFKSALPDHPIYMSTPETPDSPTKALFEQLTASRASSIETASPHSSTSNASPSHDDNWPTSSPINKSNVSLDLFNINKVSSQEEEEFKPACPEMFPVPEINSIEAVKAVESDQFAAFNDISNGLQKIAIKDDDDWPSNNADHFSTPQRNISKEDDWANFCSPKTKLSLESDEY